MSAGQGLRDALESRNLTLVVFLQTKDIKTPEVSEDTEDQDEESPDAQTLREIEQLYNENMVGYEDGPVPASGPHEGPSGVQNEEAGKGK